MLEVHQLGFCASNQGLCRIRSDDSGTEIPGEHVAEFGPPQSGHEPVVGPLPQGDRILRMGARQPVVGDDVRVDKGIEAADIHLGDGRYPSRWSARRITSGGRDSGPSVR